MKRATIDLWVGIFVTIGFAAIVFLALKVGNLATWETRPSYRLDAAFDNIGGLKLRAPVKMAGVRIGSVESIALDPAKLDAIVRISVDKRYAGIPDDSSAAIFTSGLLGDQYVGVQPGGSPDMFKDGDEFVLTQSSMQLEDLIGKFLVNGSPPKPNSASSDDKPATANPPATEPAH
jgi:phospholipid/cholesterol/gamma-HCH transport system substrate-binding protein